MGESLNYLLGPNVITRNLKKERERTYCAAVSKREGCRHRIKSESLMVLKPEGKPQAKGCRQLLGARKRQGNGFSSKPSRKKCRSSHIVTLARSDPQFQNTRSARGLKTL